MKHRKIGMPKTIGELKKIIKDYPDDTEFSFRNQSRQTLCEFTHSKKVVIYFQESKHKPSCQMPEIEKPCIKLYGGACVNMNCDYFK